MMEGFARTLYLVRERLRVHRSTFHRVAWSVHNVRITSMDKCVLRGRWRMWNQPKGRSRRDRLHDILELCPSQIRFG